MVICDPCIWCWMRDLLHYVHWKTNVLRETYFKSNTSSIILWPRKSNPSSVVFRASTVKRVGNCITCIVNNGKIQMHVNGYNNRKSNASAIICDSEIKRIVSHVTCIGSKCIANHRKSEERTSEVKCIANRAILVYVYILVYLICGRFIKNDHDFIVCLVQHL